MIYDVMICKGIHIVFQFERSSSSCHHVSDVSRECLCFASQVLQRIVHSHENQLMPKGLTLAVWLVPALNARFSETGHLSSLHINLF